MYWNRLKNSRYKKNNKNLRILTKLTSFRIIWSNEVDLSPNRQTGNVDPSSICECSSKTYNLLVLWFDINFDQTCIGRQKNKRNSISLICFLRKGDGIIFLLRNLACGRINKCYIIIYHDMTLLILPVLEVLAAYFTSLLRRSPSFDDVKMTYWPRGTGSTEGAVSQYVALQTHTLWSVLTSLSKHLTSSERNLKSHKS